MFSVGVLQYREKTCKKCNIDMLKENYHTFFCFFLTLSFSCRFLCMLNILKLKKPKYKPVVLWLCDITLCHHICRISGYIHRKNDAENMTELIRDITSGAGSDVCELTNQRTLGILKETGAFLTEGEYNPAALDSIKALFCSMWALKHLNLF